MRFRRRSGFQFFNRLGKLRKVLGVLLFAGKLRKALERLAFSRFHLNDPGIVLLGLMEQALLKVEFRLSPDFAKIAFGRGLFERLLCRRLFKSRRRTGTMVGRWHRFEDIPPGFEGARLTERPGCRFLAGRWARLRRGYFIDGRRLRDGRFCFRLGQSAIEPLNYDFAGRGRFGERGFFARLGRFGYKSGGFLGQVFRRRKVFKSGRGRF